MKPAKAEELQTILAQGYIDRAIAILHALDPTVAADAFLSLPWELQQVLFRRLPTEFAARLAPIFPYYETFVLLHALSKEQMIAVTEEMNPIELSNFLEELPEPSSQQITSELSEKPPVESPAAKESEIQQIAAPLKPIIEARGIEKSFARPGGGQVQVIAPTDLSVEPGVIIALLGPSGSGKSTLLRMLSGLTAPS